MELGSGISWAPEEMVIPSGLSLLELGSGTSSLTGTILYNELENNYL
jgi:phospholipid N-methyltransferase